MQKKRSLWFVISALLVQYLLVSPCVCATPSADAPSAPAPLPPFHPCKLFALPPPAPVAFLLVLELVSAGWRTSYY